MQLEVGETYEGKVTGVTKFGAFVALPGGQSGLVHISEIANGFVSDVGKFVQLGQTVKVMVTEIREGKVNLSMKRVQEPPQKPEPAPVEEKPADGSNFEDILKKFMQDSDSKIAGNPMYADRGKNRRRK